MDLKQFFEIPSLDQWITQLRQDLSEDDFNKLTVDLDIEEIQVISFGHQQNSSFPKLSPGNFPFTRGTYKENNDWHIGYSVNVYNEKDANKKALESLMKGSNLLLFQFTKNDTDLDQLLQGIQLAYIRTEFHVENIVQWESVYRYFENDVPASVAILIDPLLQTQQDILTISNWLKEKQFRAFKIDGKRVLEAGSASTTEVSFCLSAGHSVLFMLMESGLSIDQSAACVHFSLGIGSDYLTEISKFRAFRTLWSNIIKAYHPEYLCTYHCEINAHSISINKSLKDPHTNLLRQTTEAMSAILGGIEGLVVYPYDRHSEGGSSEFTERMALNVSLILKEESYFDTVIDPMGGSYTVETLTYHFCEKAWEFFKVIEKKGGMFHQDAVTTLNTKVRNTRQSRIEKIVHEHSILIGVNKYLNPEEKYGEENEISSAKLLTDYLGMMPLIIENEINMSE